jgi:hypothetical protein
MKQKTILMLIALVLLMASIVLTFLWFDWRLLIILFIWTWGNNITNKVELLKLLEEITEVEE